jgi:hypothetical protein
MVHFRFTNFKTGVRPSPLRKFDMENLTPTQKLTLVRNRIFGTALNDNYRTGANILKAQIQHWRAYHYQWIHASEQFPFIKNKESQMLKKQMFEKRRMRIVMRGVKIGQKKGSSTGAAANTIFDTKK